MDLKKIAKMQIGGPKYPDKKRINLYQREVKKRCRCRADCYIGGIFSIPVRFFPGGYCNAYGKSGPCGGCLSAYGSPAGSYEAGQQHYARSKKQNMPTMEIPGEMIRKQ